MVPFFKDPEDVQNWLDQDAFVLWADAGIDTATGASWEALNHDGTPCKNLDRRIRVQARQAFCFSQSPAKVHHGLAERLFRNVMARGFEPATGHLAALWSPDLEIVSAPHDLYDLAFMLLACAALLEAGHDVGDDLRRLEESLARLKAKRGWVETADCRLPRRQNPHMHLFEASIALFKATGAPRFRVQAQECLGLFKDVFLQPSGVVSEYFDADWAPYSGAAQGVEPGHMAEWIYLLQHYESVTGLSSGVDLEQVWGKVLAGQNAIGLLRDQNAKGSSTSRMWPQTEFLKASIVVSNAGVSVPATAQPSQILERLAQNFLNSEIRGGWYDKRGEDGRLLSQNMPASSLYHLVLAVRAYVNFKS